jgi:hypothetical protein
MAFVPIGCKVVFFTEEAVKIKTENGEEHWVPLSLCEEPPESGDVEIFVQEWFAEREGLE